MKVQDQRQDQEMLRSGRRLRDHEDTRFQAISVKKDMTFLEREEMRKLVSLRNQKRAETETHGGDEVWVIRRNKVVNVARRRRQPCCGQGLTKAREIQPLNNMYSVQKVQVNTNHFSVKKDLVRCVYSNVGGFLNKRLELSQFIAYEQPDVICLTEIGPKCFKFAVQKAELEMDGYECFCKLEEKIAQ